MFVLIKVHINSGLPSAGESCPQVGLGKLDKAELFCRVFCKQLKRVLTIRVCDPQHRAVWGCSVPTGTAEERGGRILSVTEVLHRQATANCKEKEKKHLGFGLL